MLSANTFLQQGRYRILRRLAAGGMGAVYEAHDQRLNIKVALKELLLPDLPLRRAFEKEAQRLARLRHSALPNVMDHFVEDKGQYLVMEYIEGEDLKGRLQQQGQAFGVEQVLAWADGLLDVLAYLHRQKPPVIHRDIKPANLKLTPEGEIILLDFGIAKGGLTQLTTNDSLAAYTLDYAPPEQITGKQTDARSDLFALGATLYHLLTGEPPENALARLASQDSDPLLPVNQLNSQVPAYVADALTAVMALDPAKRPNSADELRKKLFPPASEATTGVSRQPSPPSPPAQASQQPLRWLIVVGGALFLAAIVIGIANVWFLSPAASTPTEVVVTDTDTDTDTDQSPTPVLVTDTDTDQSATPVSSLEPSPTTADASANPTITQPPRATGTVLLHTSLDNLQSLPAPVVGIGGISNQLEEQDFVPAQVGNGVHFKKEGQSQVVTFTIAKGNTKNINLDRGEIEFWYRPNYVASTHTGKQHTLFRMAIDGYNPPALQLSSGQQLIFSVTDPEWNEYYTSTPYGASLWKVGEWVQIRATWDNTIPDDSLQLYVNNVRVDLGGASGGWKLEETTNPLWIYLGAQTPAGDFIANGVIDEFIIREMPSD